jgi:hypothetical protein
MFRTENWVCCLMEYSLDLSVSMHEEHHLYAKSRVQVNGRKTSVFKRILHIRNKRV